MRIVKKSVNSIVSACIVLVLLLLFASCGDSAEKSGLWENALYLRDTEFGKGNNTLTLEVKAGEEIVTFTVNTDKKTVGEALAEHGLIEGEEGPYGLYVKVVHGIRADYDIDKSYWAFYVDGEYAVQGIDSTEITKGTVYQLVYSK